MYFPSDPEGHPHVTFGNIMDLEYRVPSPQDFEYV